jgi:hypothetical protein
MDDKDSFNGTGLIRAAERGHHRIVARLLPDGTGVRPLTHARRRGYAEIARLLEEAGGATFRPRRHRPPRRVITRPSARARLPPRPPQSSSWRRRHGLSTTFRDSRE